MVNPPSGNMYNWAYTWNPLAGECSHHCDYCYVERLRKMGLKKYQGDIRLSESALRDDLTIPYGFILFVCSCQDLFANNIPPYLVETILRCCRQFPETHFLFQTKNPQGFMQYKGLFPPITTLGITLETNRDEMLSGRTLAPVPSKRFEDFFIVGSSHKMVSIEPIMQFDHAKMVYWMMRLKPDFVSIGADSKRHRLPEPLKWQVLDLIEALQEFTEVKTKKNLQRIIGNG